DVCNLPLEVVQRRRLRNLRFVRGKGRERRQGSTALRRRRGRLCGGKATQAEARENPGARPARCALCQKASALCSEPVQSLKRTGTVFPGHGGLSRQAFLCGGVCRAPWRTQRSTSPNDRREATLTLFSQHGLVQDRAHAPRRA